MENLQKVYERKVKESDFRDINDTKKEKEKKKMSYFFAEQ